MQKYEGHGGIKPSENNIRKAYWSGKVRESQ